MAHLFFRDEQFEFEIKTALGGVYHGCGDVGEILATAAAIRDGDDDSWTAQWNALATRVRPIAESCARDGRRVSAYEAFLRAAAYYANTFNVSLRNPRKKDELLSAFTAHRQCFDEFCALSDTPVDRLEIPYAGTTMPAYLMRPDATGGPHPVLLVTNGSDGAITWAYSAGAAGALRRGYAVLLYDGPGQQSMLFQKKTYFRPDWEAVIGPVIDVLEKRPDVDPAVIVLLGTSQAGFWVTRAAAFDHRAAADGADLHCQPMGRNLTDQRVFDWLDATLRRP